MAVDLTTVYAGIDHGAGKVDEVISMLELARDEAKKVAAARNGDAFRGNKAVVRATTRTGSATQ